MTERLCRVQWRLNPLKLVIIKQEPLEPRMLVDSMDQSLPPVAAWKKYLGDRDSRQLLAWMTQESDSSSLVPFFLWLAIEASDWDLATTLLDRCNHVLPYCESPAGGPLAAAISDFGDAPHVVEWLINHGSRIDTRGMNDWTPLHMACQYGFLGVAEVLVAHGANLNDQTRIDGGYTPLMEACAGGHKEVVEFLLLHGADPEIRNSYEGGTARRVAAKHAYSEIVTLLDEWASPVAMEKRTRTKWKGKRKKDAK
jgi:hypothetical protein